MSALWVMLQQPWHEQRQQRLLWISWVFAAGAVGAPLLGAWLGAPRPGMGIGLGTLGSLAFLWWGVFVRSAVMQNQPAHAVLVPRLRRRLILLTVMVWAAGSVALAIPVSLMTGHFGPVLCGIGFMMLFVLALQRYIWLAVLPAAVIFLNPAMSRAVAAVSQMFAALGDAGILAGGVLLNALLAAVVLRLVFPRGGDRHQKWFAALQKQDETRRTGLFAARLDGWHTAIHGGYGRTVESGAGSLLLHAMGPQAHWGAMLKSGALLAVLALAAGIWQPPQDVSETLASVVLLPAALMPPMIFAVQLRLLMQRSTGEQALLRLSPAAPAARQFNRELARAMAGRFLACWLISTASVALAGMLYAQSFWMPPALPAMAAIALGAGAMILQDYASLPSLKNNSSAMLAPIAVASALAAFAGETALPWAWIAAACVPLAAWLWRLRWQGMMAARPAFPAARG
ncbi:hypothetical protein [Massilia endophytica]|uniref:hypothetical protein n=1 Tax=Massilia endophytica TaxID=2899220 RepID=UPI001E3FA0C7|nr:hypothetical protein [Massilia endophytica]UGQ48905.1 hypothetical protein LSQ66_10705 [Massilia endophytica]